MSHVCLDCRWGARLEGAQACAGHLAATLAALALLHPAFSRWNRRADTRAAANRPFCSMPPRLDELTRIFERNMCSTDVPGAGYHLSAWNGLNGPCGSSFRLNAGSDSRYSVFPNKFEVRFQPSAPANADLVNFAVLKPALLAAASAWTPDYAAVAPQFYVLRWQRDGPWDDLDTKHKGGRYVPWIGSGWMTYLCADYARRIVSPHGIEVEPVTGGGILLIATRDVFTPGNPEHDAAADAIQDALLPLQNLPCKAMRG